MKYLGLAAMVGLMGAWKPVDVPQMLVQWEASRDSALSKAKGEGKPILYFHLLGRLDEEFC